MSEYWVSKKKYFCRYCEIYIADDVPSRQQHENGLRHKGNTERFIRNLYKTSEKRKKEHDDEKREMARVEQAAQAAFAQDVGAGLAKSSTRTTPAASSSSTSAPAVKPPAKPVSRFANYSTPASLGYKDPDVERLAAEAELRRTQGVAGEWELVTQTPQPVAEVDGTGSSSAAPAGGHKREPDAIVDDEDDGRRFKLRKKTLGGGLGEIYDSGIIPIKLKKKEESIESITSTTQPVEGAKQPTEPPKWTKVQWKQIVVDDDDDETKRELRFNDDGGTTAANGDKVEREPMLSLTAKAEEQPSLPPLDQDRKEDILPKPENSSSGPPVPESGGDLFRKRKVPTGVTRGKRRT